MKNIYLLTVLVMIALFAAEGCAAPGERGATAHASTSLTPVTYAAEIARPETGPSKPTGATTAPTTDSTGSPQAGSPQAGSPQTSPADDAGADEESDETAWKIITTTLDRDGVRKDAVLIVTVPRDDLFVALDGNDVPTAAGVESIFNFWHCSCGKTSVVGQFCVADYESNDVIDALRAGHIEIASIAPMVLHSRVSPLILRFQGEGKAGDLAKTLKAALSWMGKERMAPDLPGTK